MKRGRVTIAMALVAMGISGCKAPQHPAGLTVRQSADQIVLHWNGPVQAPMSERFAEALETHLDDPRKIVISLNSPGGLVAHGHNVIRAIRKASRERPIDTVVAEGQSCASMCIPIFLVGAERSAHPKAQFMFHEASIRFRPEAERELRKLDPGTVEQARRQLAARATSDMFEDDLGPRSIDAKWLENLRQRIKGRDVWFTARQLVQQGSGVVDRLL